jgi:hypothetical protein
MDNQQNSKSYLTHKAQAEGLVALSEGMNKVWRNDDDKEK